MTPLETPVLLRCWPELAHASICQQKEATQKKPHWITGRSTWIGKRVLVIHVQPTADGSWLGLFQRCIDGRKAVEGVFIPDNLHDDNADRLEALRAYAQRNRLLFMTRTEFMRYWFFPEAYGLGALVVGFDLPPQLVQLSAAWGACIGANRDAFFIRLVHAPWRPRIMIRPLTCHAAWIEFMPPKPQGTKGKWRRFFPGRFLDLKTLSYALSADAHDLYTAGPAFGAKIQGRRMSDEAKGKAERQRRSLDDELTDARRQLAATFSLYVALRDRCKAFSFVTSMPEALQGVNETPITKLYSPASLAKGLLRAMGVRPFLDTHRENPGALGQFLGNAMTTLYGGRVETRIRRLRVPVILVDFASQYPSVFSLLNLWPFMIAQRVEVDEGCSDETQSVLQSIARDPHALFNPQMWSGLVGYVLVQPDGDILPERVPLGDADDGKPSDITLTVAPVTSAEPVWKALPDVAASVILTGRVPLILRAFRPVPVGTQDMLRCVSVGDTVLDPRAPNPLAALTLLRKRLKDCESGALASGVKMLLNSLCSGILIEFNPELLESKEAVRQVTLYAERAQTRRLMGKVEKPGKFTSPLIGPLVTAGGRLLLAMLQREVETQGGVFAWTATDAAAIVAGQGGPVEGLPASVRTLTEDEVTGIRAKFQPLWPFDPDAVPSFLKVEAKGLGFAIASNRYCIQRFDGAFDILVWPLLMAKCGPPV